VAEAQYQSLYRRYRPQRFSEVLGQDNVVLALKNAVHNEKVAHAYLFSGPRGTGKTSMARILAKALNCEHPTDGEPDGTCDSCIRIQQGNSLDVYELDAASNNGVDAMRDLVGRAALGTPGRWKVYIVDEVHMLSTAASNALLKTLEEPPAHVVFVLATTDPQKVLPTIRSRTQHFEFRLLSPTLLTKLVQQINGDANLHLATEALDLVVRRGKGSARDTLSVLDQVAAAGVIEDEHEVIDELTEALCERDTGRALIAIAEAMNMGRDAQRVAVDLLEYLRNGFLAMMAKGLVALPDNARDRVEEQARRLGAPALVRAMEGLGAALLDMRDSPEARVTLEVAIVRLTKPELNVDVAALVERIARLEQNGPGHGNGSQSNSPAHQAPNSPASKAGAGPEPRPAESRSIESRPAESRPAATKADSSTPPPATGSTARPTLGALRRQTQGAPPAPSSEPEATKEPASPESPAVASAAPTAHVPTRDELVEVWGDKILDQLPQRAKARYRTGRFTDVSNGRAVFALPNAFHKERCEEVRNEVEVALRNQFGVHIPLMLTVEEANDENAGGAMPAQDDEVIDLSETTLSTEPGVSSPSDRLLKAFPGAEEVPQ
jgi:DNA polymerase III subunit gamma/tau